MPLFVDRIKFERRLSSCEPTVLLGVASVPGGTIIDVGSPVDLPRCTS